MQREENMRLSLQGRLDEQARQLEDTERRHRIHQQAHASELEQTKEELMECKSALHCELAAQLSRASSSARERELEKERATQDADRARSLAREGEARSAQLAQEKAKNDGELRKLRERVENYELRLEEGEEEVRKLEEQLVLLLVRQPRSPVPK